jgi:hypothetical protein
VPGAELFVLDGVGDIDLPVVAVAEVALDPFALVPDDEDDVLDARVGDCFEDVLEKRPIPDGDHRFRPRAGERSEAHPFPRRKNNCVHTLLQMRRTSLYMLRLAQLSRRYPQPATGLGPRLTWGERKCYLNHARYRR